MSGSGWIVKKRKTDHKVQPKRKPHPGYHHGITDRKSDMSKKFISNLEQTVKKAEYRRQKLADEELWNPTPENSAKFAKANKKYLQICKALDKKPKDIH